MSQSPAAIVDFHTHAYPDALASRTIPFLVQEAAKLPGGHHIQAHSNGRLSGLEQSMDRAGVARAVVATIATKPSQTDSIFKWCSEVEAAQSLLGLRRRFVMFPSVHPADPQAPAWLDRIIQAGFKGIKFHPYYQGFRLDHPAFVSLVRQAAGAGLVMLCHCGYDIAWPRERTCDPALVLDLYHRMPEIKFVAAHLGGWDDWDTTERLLIGQPIYMDTAFSLPFLSPERVAQWFMEHPAHHLLFGSDSPWTDQSMALDELAKLREYGLTEARYQEIAGGTATSLLS